MLLSYNLENKSSSMYPTSEPSATGYSPLHMNVIFETRNQTLGHKGHFQSVAGKELETKASNMRVIKRGSWRWT